MTIVNESSFPTPYIIGWTDLAPVLSGKAEFKPGETTIIASFVHNFKTGFLHSLLAQIAYLNNPSVSHPDRKPLLVIIDGENGVEDISDNILKNTVENVTGRRYDTRDEPDTQLGRALLNVSKFEIKIIKIIIGKVTAENLITELSSLENDGYEICGVFIDGLSFLKPSEGIPLGDSMVNAAQSFIGFAKSRGALMFVTHHLDYLSHTHPPLNELAGKGYHSQAPSLPKLFDNSLLIGIGRSNGTPHLNVVREPDSGESPPYTTRLTFANIGTIPWDKTLRQV